MAHTRGHSVHQVGCLREGGSGEGEGSLPSASGGGSADD